MALKSKRIRRRTTKTGTLPDCHQSYIHAAFMSFQATPKSMYRASLHSFNEYLSCIAVM